MRDVVVCTACGVNPAEHGEWCIECYEERRGPKVPVTAEATDGMQP